MGEMKLAPIIGENFQYYVPILIVVICFLNLFDVLGRIARRLGFKDDLFGGSGENDNSDDWGDVEDGRILIAEGTSVAMIVVLC